MTRATGITIQIICLAITALAYALGGISWHPVVAMVGFLAVTMSRSTMLSSYILIVALIGMVLWWTGVHGHGFVILDWLR